MYKIKKLNSISQSIESVIPADRFAGEGADDFDAVLVRSADMHELELPDSVVAVARAGAGVNNIPVTRMSERGVVVFNTPGANANAVKELTLCGMLLSCRDLLGGEQWVREQGAQGTQGVEKLAEKVKSRFAGRELMGKRLGVVGLGAIGVLVANAACNGLGMEVAGYDPYMSVEAAWKLTRGVMHASGIEEIFATCDFITLHLPLTDSTRGMVDARLLGRMKRGAVLLNFARGGLVDEDAAKAALADGTLAKYVTDFAGDGIIGTENVIAFPHLGASTAESEENCAVMAAKQLKSYLEDGNIENSVNFPVCELPRSGGFRVAVIHRNVTNMVGQITALLAAEGNNIEHMINTSKGEWAYTLLELADRPSPESLGKISEIDGVVRVRTLF